MPNRKYILFTGVCWSLIGLYLYMKGALLLDNAHVSKWFRVVGIVLGVLKYVFVINRAAQKMVQHIASQPPSVRIWNVYPVYYAKLVAGMMFLGVSLNVLPVPITLRAVIDIAIGTALILGSSRYFSRAKSPTVNLDSF